MLNIVLHEPEIPFNTGAIGRTCVATNTRLHLIEPFGFILNDKNIKRAGMDYWAQLDVHRYINYEEFLRKNPGIIQEASEKSADRGMPGELSGVAKGYDAGETVGERTGPKLWFATTKARQTYCDVSFGPDDYIMFGKESAGIPEEILVEQPERCIRIPMWGDIRSLNLSNSAAVILYEALRQNGFSNMEKQGALHRLHWT